MLESTLTDTNQITNFTVTLTEEDDELLLPIPQDIMEELDIQEGDELEWFLEDDQTIILKKVQQ